MTRRILRPIYEEGDISYITLGPDSFEGLATVDTKFLDEVRKYSWMLGSNGYASGWVKDKPVLLHHFIIGKPDKGFVVDHINRNKLDNRLENIRVIKRGLNSINIDRQKNNTSGFRGVYKVKKSGRDSWQAKIKVKYKSIHLGTFNDKKLAAQAYDDAAKLYFKEYAVLNFSGVENGK